MDAPDLAFGGELILGVLYGFSKLKTPCQCQKKGDDQRFKHPLGGVDAAPGREQVGLPRRDPPRQARPAQALRFPRSIDRQSSC